MLTRLTVELDTDNITYRNSSVFQGVLFERVSPLYADFLHQQSMHPYSQYVYKKDDKTYWIIQTLNKEAYEEIILPFMDAGFRSFYVEKVNEEISVISKTIETKEKKDLLDAFYFEQSIDNMTLDFLSCTSFRQNGSYVIMPDLRLIYQNLMNRYSACSEKIDLWDEESLDQLSSQSMISRYQLHSVTYPMEKMNFPGFMGRIHVRVKGTETMKRYVRFLFRFAEYSGIGIKTSMGMGAVRLKTEECR